MRPIPPSAPAEAPQISADLWRRIGDVPAERIFIEPRPGTATEADVIAARSLPERWISELVEGVLIMKAPGFLGSVFATDVVSAVLGHVHEDRSGIVIGASAFMRLKPGLVRCVDVAYFSWDRFPGRRIPQEEIPSVTPDLVVDILRPGNTESEMLQKARDYITAGTRIVWHLDPYDHSGRVFQSPDRFTTLEPSAVLDGGEVLPGFRFDVRQSFDRIDRPFEI